MLIEAGYYYSITISASGFANPAYFSLTPTSAVQIAQGGVTIAPIGPSATMVNIYPQTLQIQSPAGVMNGGVTVVTNDTHIAGTVQVSPPVEVSVTIQVWGTKLLGTYTLDPNQQTGAFDIHVSPEDAIPAADAAEGNVRYDNQQME
jgi:hypothetical protein